jgi:hypothetical protein
MSPTSPFAYNHYNQDLPLDPYARALHLLHVGATPESLPGREEEYADVLVKIEGVIEGGGGGCVCEFCLAALFHEERNDVDPVSYLELLKLTTAC